MSESSAPGSESPDQPGNGEPASATSPPIETPASASDPHGHAGTITRVLTLLAAVVCFVGFRLAGRWLEIPRFRGYEVSLMQLPGGAKVTALLAAAVLLVVCAMIGHFIAGRFWLYAGVFAAACGLGGWSFRGGPSGDVYRHAADNGDAITIFLLLALELLLLAGFVGAIWFAVTAAGRELTDEPGAGDEPRPSGLSSRRLQALGFQVLLTGVLVMFLTPTDAKKEVMASVFFGSLIGAAVTQHYFSGEDLTPWYWLGPLAVGVIGYVLNYLNHGAGATPAAVTGHLSGLFAPLGRPLPLDYASAGIVGALLGFWAGGEHPDLSVGMGVFHPATIRRALGRATAGGSADRSADEAAAGRTAGRPAGEVSDNGRSA